LIGSDALYAMVVFAIISMVAVSMIYVALNVTPILAKIPGFSTAYTPEIANGVICQTSNQVFLNNQTLTVNNVQTVNTICRTSYIAQTPSNTVSWLSPLAAVNSILANYNAVDTWIYFIFILVNLAILASVAFLPNVSPMALAIGFLTLVIVVIISFILSNSINVFFNVPLLGNAVAKIPNVRGLWANIGEYEILFGLIYLIIIAARSRGAGGVGANAGNAHL